MDPLGYGAAARRKDGRIIRERLEREHPDAVVFTVLPLAAFAYPARIPRVHVVADSIGITEYRGIDEIGWTLTWPEIMDVSVATKVGLGLLVSAYIWGSPVLLEPVNDNDSLLEVASMRQLAIRILAKRPGNGDPGGVR